MSNTFSTIPYISTIIRLIIKTTFNIKVKKPTSNLSLYSSYSVSSYILYLNDSLPLQDSPHQYLHLLLKEFNRLPINFSRNFQIFSSIPKCELRPQLSAPPQATIKRTTAIYSKLYSCREQTRLILNGINPDHRSQASKKFLRFFLYPRVSWPSSTNCFEKGAELHQSVHPP